MSLSRRELLFGWRQPKNSAAVRGAAAADVPSFEAHLLNRLSFGATAESLAEMQAMGWQAYLEAQLHPAELDDPAGDAVLAGLPLWQLSRREMYALGDIYSRVQPPLLRGIVDLAVYSRRQLQERMVDFWRDHFNVPFEAADPPDLFSYERDVLRPHALGRFRDLLLAVAQSPAMLIYLDNAHSYADHPNENYARELLELHTLGVDGGYTEADVKEVARAFTGWTVHPKTADGFIFDMERHDTEEKWVLGQRLPAGRGIEDGLHVLTMLLNHPATAAFLSRKLCVHFVSDNPPPSLIDSTAAVWRQSGGYLPDVLRHLFSSAEFAAMAGQKLKRPFHFFVGALRATGTRFGEYWTLYEGLLRLGHLPYGWPAPNGYPAVSAAWASSGSLLLRWNTANWLTFAAAADPENSWGVVSDLRQQVGQPATVGDLVDEVAVRIWGQPLGDPLREQFVRYAADGGEATTPLNNALLHRKLASLFGLMLSSPAFQQC